MALTFTIAGVDRTDWFATGSASMGSRYNGRSSLTAKLRDRGRGYIPVNGSPIIVQRDADASPPGEKLFGGFITSIEAEQEAKLNSFAITYTIKAIDFSSICDNRRITASYSGMTLGDIVAAIVDRFLDGEGISTAGVETGPTIDYCPPFVRVTVSEAFNVLSKITGNQYRWWVDPDKVLFFSSVESSPAPTDIDDSTALFYLKVTRDAKDYRNVQTEVTEHIVGTAYALAKSFTGDGSTADFFADTPFIGVPEVLLDDVKLAVGRLGWDDPADFEIMYDVDGIGLHFISPQTAPTLGQVLDLNYNGKAQPLPNYVTVSNDSEITSRAAIEGGSGRHEAVSDQRNVDTLEALTDLADGELDSNDQIPIDIDITIDDVSGFAIGQSVHITRSAFGIDDDFFIESVDSLYVGAAQDFVRQSLKCSDQYLRGRSTKYLERIAEMARIAAGSASGSSPGISDPGSPGGGGSALPYVEVPYGARDGVNTTFVLTYYPSPQYAVLVMLNGIVQNPFFGRITIDSNLIEFASPPKATDSLWVLYFAGGGAGLYGSGGVPGASLGKARDFDGSGDVVDWGNDPSFLILGDLSFGLWVKLRSTSDGTMIAFGQYHAGIAAKNTPFALDVNGGSSGAWNIRYYHDYGAAGTEYKTWGLTAVNDLWYYFGISRDTTQKKIYWYVGDETGNFALSQVDDYTNNPDGATDSGNKLTVGAYEGSGGVEDFDGAIEEYGIWNRVLTQAEHYAFFKRNPPRAGAVLLCRGGDTPEADTSGNGHSGAVTGTTVVAGH